MAAVTMSVKPHRGFSLIEVLVVIGILGVLAGLAVPRFQHYRSKAKRVEATAGLAALRNAQLAYRAIHEDYASSIDQLDVDYGRAEPDGSRRTKNYHFVMTRPGGPKTFQLTATGNIDSDPFLDILVVSDP